MRSPLDHSLPAANSTSRFHILLAKGQGAYDLFGGFWPLLHMQSFEAVTGPKDDSWLVRTVAGILVVVGAVLVRDAFRGHVAQGVRFIAAGVSAVLAIVALVSSLAGFISWLYFFDGLIHLAFAMAWLLGTLLHKHVIPRPDRDALQ
jgi:hypothetical protein